MKNNKNKFCIFYIVRHGETEWNVKGIMQGQKNSRLNKNGINQAKKIAKFFKNVKFDKIFSSDLMRTKKTAEIIAIEHQMAVACNKLLRERNFGDYQGKKVSVYRKQLKGLLKKRNNLPKKERFKFKLQDNIESDEEIVSRLITFLRETAIAYPGKKILIVCHGGLMRTFLIHLGFAEYEELPSGSIKNTGYAVVESDGVDFFVKETFGINKKNNFTLEI